jgi:hypothetical protein
MGKGEMSADDMKWQAEDDIRVLSRAEELEADLAKDPERKKRMIELAKSRMTEMAALINEKD